MKKIFVLFLAILAMVCFSTASFASCKTAQTESIALDSGGDATVGLSANVVATYCSSGTTYAAVSHNPKGVDRSYGTASDTTYIYYATGNAASGWTDEDSSTFTSPTWTKVGGE